MNKVEAKLDCTHLVRVKFTDMNTATVGYCRFDGWQSIAEFYPEEWRIVCLDCQYGRWTGQNQTTATRDAGKHEFFRKHQVVILYDKITGSGGTPRADIIRDNRRREEANRQTGVDWVSDKLADDPPF